MHRIVKLKAMLAMTGSLVMMLALSDRANAASYVYDFHFNAEGSYATSDISYTSDKIAANTLDYLSGSVNGLIINPLVFNGFSYSAGYGLFGDEGNVVSYFFAPDTAITGLGSYVTTYNAKRGIGYPGGGTAYDNGSGVLTISLASAVPEPKTWAMLLVGFGVVGAAMRERRRLSVKLA